jgi:hypothetical protein
MLDADLVVAVQFDVVLGALPDVLLAHVRRPLPARHMADDIATVLQRVHQDASGVVAAAYGAYLYVIAKRPNSN